MVYFFWGLSISGIARDLIPEIIEILSISSSGVSFSEIDCGLILEMNCNRYTSSPMLVMI